MIQESWIKFFLLSLLLPIFLIGCAHTGHPSKAPEVFIGFVGPLTGPNADFGNDSRNAAVMAIEQANTDGVNIGGFPTHITLVTEDDQRNPQVGIMAARNLIGSKVSGVVGYINSGTAIPASPIFESANVPLITPSASNPQLTHQGFKNVFRAIANDTQQGEAIGKFAVSLLDAHRIVILDDGTRYGTDLASAAESEVKKSGAEVILHGTYSATDSASLERFFAKIETVQFDVFLYGGDDSSAIQPLIRLRELNDRVPFVAGDGICTDKMISGARSILNSSTYCTTGDVPLEYMVSGAGFAAKYKERFGSAPKTYAPYTYDAVMALLQAMKEANSVDPLYYRDKLRGLEMHGITGDVNFDGNGDLIHPSITLYNFNENRWMMMKVIRNGAMVSNLNVSNSSSAPSPNK